MSNYKVKYLQGTKQITLLRNLLAAMVYESVGAHEDEVKVIFDLVPQLLEKAEKDEQFGKKHYKFLIRSYNLISELNVQSFPFRPSKEHREQLRLQLHGWLPSESAYYGWARNPAKAKSFLVVPQGLHLRLPKNLKSKRFIGVGYRDKGLLRDPAKDSSPSWKDVAQDSAYLERIAEEDPDYLKFLQKTGPRRKKKRLQKASVTEKE